MNHHTLLCAFHVCAPLRSAPPHPLLFFWRLALPVAEAFNGGGGKSPLAAGKTNMIEGHLFPLLHTLHPLCACDDNNNNKNTYFCADWLLSCYCWLD
jgi:hypothetical protein